MKRLLLTTRNNFIVLTIMAFMSTLMMLSTNLLHAQTTYYPTVSGGWDAGKIQGVGYNDYGNGVVMLLNNTANGCEGAGIYETTDTYNPCSGNFSKCYHVVFGCDDNGADGLAFMFSTCNAVTDYQVWGCGGGLGYIDACPGNKGITIEFDTYNNAGVDDFDTGYEGTGTQDQIAIHKDMQAKTGPGKVTGVAVPNLEDGLEHIVCINYDNTTHELSATIDGITRITYDMDNAGLEFRSYFFGGGCGALNQSWTAGTNGGTNFEVVSNGASIYTNAGQVCPQMLPVEFIDVTAKYVDNSVAVLWSTATETNNKQFVIERSLDGITWASIGDVKGKGNSSSVTEYTYIDYVPLSGIGYYRVKQVDLDGKYSYSKIVAVKINTTQVTIAPNPFNESLTISSDASGEVVILITDVLGKVLYQSSNELENGSVTIQPELAPGVYVVTIKSDSFTEQQGIIKQ